MPAKIIKYRFSEETIELLLRLKWWELNGDELKQFSEVFGDVSEFISEVNKYRKDKNDKYGSSYHALEECASFFKKL